jgi:mycothiol synthase
MRVLLAYDGGALRAGGFLSPATDGSHSLHLVLDPSLHPGPDTEAIRDSLIDGALAEPEGRGTVRLWSMRANEADAAAAARHGFVPERELVQMRVPLPLPTEVVAGARPVLTRPFERGRDEDHWLDVNNRAFAGHPEQGNWTRAELEERLSADWVDLNGFLIADDPEGDGIIGSCWTKIHRHDDPALGEIYVISVDPLRHSQGWGKALTVAGLVWLADQGIAAGMLYTDGDNAAAVALYRSLGFSVDHVDRAYVHKP